jgi:hypothetical protein
MVRITIDIDDAPDVMATKEAVAMRLEGLGRVRIVSILTGREQEKDGSQRR